MAHAIELAGVTKSFGPKVAVQELDLVIREGGLYGLIGPNGAGKTTTIRMIMSILFPDSGSIRVLGHGSALEAKDRIGYLPEERGLYKKMKVGAFLHYIARLKGQSSHDLKARVRAWLERLDLPGVEHKPCEELSKGMQQKVQFIAAVIHRPDLLILDEPFSGLDPVAMRLLRDLVREEHERGATIIFSTHVMYQAEQLCDQILMIHDGRKVLDDTLQNIRASHDPRVVRFEPLDPATDPSRIGLLSFVDEVAPVDGTWQITLRDGTDLSAAIREIVARVPPAKVEIHRPTLEDVFVGIVRSSRATTMPKTPPSTAYGDAAAAGSAS
jgi:ABC-2 type transport system ATP-binding protein